MSWKKWFAWYPVKVGGELVWRRWIFRKWNPNGGALVLIDILDRGEMTGEWEYRVKRKEVMH